MEMTDVVQTLALLALVFGWLRLSLAVRRALKTVERIVTTLENQNRSIDALGVRIQQHTEEIDRLDQKWRNRGRFN